MRSNIKTEFINDDNYSYEHYSASYLFGALKIYSWCEDRRPGQESPRKYKINIGVELFGKKIFWAVVHSGTKGLNAYAEQVDAPKAA